MGVPAQEPEPVGHPVSRRAEVPVLGAPCYRLGTGAPRQGCQGLSALSLYRVPTQPRGAQCQDLELTHLEEQVVTAGAPVPTITSLQRSAAGK